MSWRTRLFSSFLIAVFLLAALPAGLASAAQEKIVSPGLCRVRTDMELPWVGSLPTNYHSRTRLAAYSHIPGGVTPATVRLQGGKGNVQLPAAWQKYVGKINGDNAGILKYLFHRDSGWQNSDQYARVEELVFENQYVNVLRVSGMRAYVGTYFIDRPPPATVSVENRQLFTIVTREDTIIGSPKGNAYIILIARPGEQLWIPIAYLDCPSRLPFKTITHTPGARLNVRAAPVIGEVLTTFDDGTPITIFALREVNGGVWGLTTEPGSIEGWVAMWFTDWGR
jgi:hypothetical protein